MRGAIIIKEPYHDSFGLSLTLKEIVDKMDRLISYNIGIQKINEEIKNLKDIDYLIVWMNKELINLEGLDKLEIPVIMATCDTPKRLLNDSFKKAVEKHKPKGLIVEGMCTIPIYKDYLNNENFDFFWFPWGIDENYVKDYKEEKIYDVSQTGQFNRYEFRREINMLLDARTDINYYRTSPERDTNKVEKFTYDEYCKILNRSKISIGGCFQNRDQLYYKGKFIGNMFSKNFEIAGCKSALFNTTVGDKDILGLKDGENFVEFKNPRDCIRKINYYIEQPELIEKITERGYRWAHIHTNKIHAERLFSDIERVFK
jgi:hypothetical protein